MTYKFFETTLEFFGYYHPHPSDKYVVHWKHVSMYLPVTEFQSKVLRFMGAA